MTIIKLHVSDQIIT